jgi:hypothetical protein
MSIDVSEIRAAAMLAEFQGADLKDPRRVERLEAVVAAIARKPSASFAKMCPNEADREGLYKFIRNPHLEWSALLDPHIEQTISRAKDSGSVLVLHDTSEARVWDEADLNSFLQPSRRGFLIHASLVVDAKKIRSPLGIASLEAIERKKGPSKLKRKNGKRMRGNETAKLKNKEFERWFRNVQGSAENLASVDHVVHVMDAEGDSYKLLENMNQGGHRFVVRLCHDRVAKAAGDDSWAHVRSVLDNAREFKRVREVQVSRRKANRRPGSRKARSARTAKLTFAFERVVLKRPAYLTDDDAEPSLELNVVRVFEKSPPQDVAPIEWMLLTNEDVMNKAHAERIVDIYRQRWLIEEFFKSLKTSCGFRTRKLKNPNSIYNSLALLTPFAWRALALRQAARTVERPARKVFSDDELTLLVAKAKSIKSHFRKHHSAADALLFIAQIAGHRKSNGPPGWVVIVEGLQELALMLQGWKLARGEQITG